MWQFIFTILLMTSLGAILYLAVRSLPRISEEEEKRAGLIERWVMSEMPAKLDQTMNAYTGKFFRKLKIYIMRLDNFLTEKLKKMSGGENGGLTGQGKPRIDFRDIAKERNGGEEKEKKESLL